MVMDITLTETVLPGSVGLAPDEAKWVTDLDSSRDVIDDADGLGLRVAWQTVWDDVVLHLPWRLGARLLPVNGLTGGALQASILGRQRGCQAHYMVPPPEHLLQSMQQQ